MIELATVRQLPRTRADSVTIRVRNEREIPTEAYENPVRVTSTARQINGLWFDAMTGTPIKTTTKAEEKATVARLNRLLRRSQPSRIPPWGWFLITLGVVLGVAAIIHFA